MHYFGDNRYGFEGILILQLCCRLLSNWLQIIIEMTKFSWTWNELEDWHLEPTVIRKVKSRQSKVICTYTTPG